MFHYYVAEVDHGSQLRSLETFERVRNFKLRICSCVIIILSNTGLYKSVLFTGSLGKLVFLSSCAFYIFYLLCVKLDVIFINFVTIA